MVCADVREASFCRIRCSHRRRGRKDYRLKPNSNSTLRAGKIHIRHTIGKLYISKKNIINYLATDKTFKNTEKLKWNIYNFPVYRVTNQFSLTNMSFYATIYSYIGDYYIYSTQTDIKLQFNDFVFKRRVTV